MDEIIRSFDWELGRFVEYTSDEEVDYGSPDIDTILHTDSDHAWSTHGNDSQD
jgi:hypothetical protein